MNKKEQEIQNKINSRLENIEPELSSELKQLAQAKFTNDEKDSSDVSIFNSSRSKNIYTYLSKNLD